MYINDVNKTFSIFHTVKHQFNYFLDLIKLYNHPEMNPDVGPLQLQNKVQFDIRYYFCRRGQENISDMTADTFTLIYNNTQMCYVKKVKDELTKNYRENSSQMITGFMPQILNPQTGFPHRVCPLRSFENYINILNPNSKKLWQQLLGSMSGEQYDKHLYKSTPVGHNTLDKFMSNMSEKCGLLQRYTNHCVRVTGVTNLARSNYTSKQIMNVSAQKVSNPWQFMRRLRQTKS